MVGKLASVHPRQADIGYQQIDSFIAEHHLQPIGPRARFDRSITELLEDVDDQETNDSLACSMGLEGIIAKRRNAPYRSGRAGDWLKIKCIQSETFLILGYEPSGVALGGIGRLLLAARKGIGIAYVGSVGTGFSVKTATDLKSRLRELVIERPAVTIKAKGMVWVTPCMPAEIAFRGWTNDGNLRHASYKGLREEADVDDVYELDAN